jgi:hypothetical protein
VRSIGLTLLATAEATVDEWVTVELASLTGAHHAKVLEND